MLTWLHRYPGFSALMQSFKDIGLLDTEHKIQLDSWTDLPELAAQAVRDSTLSGLSPSQIALAALTDLGLLPGSATPLSIPAPTQPAAPIDLFATALAHALRYHPGERDLVLLHHEIVARPAAPHGAPRAEAGVHEDVHTASLAVYGDARASAMARTVGMPLAFAVRAVLDGGVAARGVVGPGVERAVWGRVLSGLEEAGLGMKETVRQRIVGGGPVERALAGARGAAAV